MDKSHIFLLFLSVNYYNIRYILFLWISFIVITMIGTKNHEFPIFSNFFQSFNFFINISREKTFADRPFLKILRKKLSRKGQKNAKPQNFLPSKVSDLKVILINRLQIYNRLQINNRLLSISQPWS